MPNVYFTTWVEMGISYYRIFSGSAYLENEKRTMHGLVDSRSESFESEVVNTETETCVYKPFIFLWQAYHPLVPLRMRKYNIIWSFINPDTWTLLYANARILTFKS